MKNSNYYESEYSVYPGEYVPMLEEDKIHEELRQLNKEDIVSPPVNITELSNSFKVEVAIPGVKREEFLVQVDENILSVSVLHQYFRSQNSGNVYLHEFDHQYFDRHITLPKNVDPEFSRAEYNSGILRLDIAKTKQAGKRCHIPIAVY